MKMEEKLKIILKGAAEVIDVKELEEKLLRSEKEDKPLIVKLGLDPTAPDLHLGHTVVLRKAKQLQDLGHKILIIIGDFTGQIGDPTGKSKARKQLTKEEVLQNAETYRKQLTKVLDPESTEIRFNSEWLSTLNFQDVMTLASKYTVTRMLERDDFKKRMAAQQSISIHEFFYPLMQGYDSIAIKADIELGGTDQKFNILMGRTLQKEYDIEKQIAIFMPILEGTDGIEKMSKSLGNYIGIDEDKKEIYGKVMSIPDSLIIKFFELTTDLHPDEIQKMAEAIEVSAINPRDLKMRLGREIVELYHGKEAAVEAENHFKNVFQNKCMPTEIAEFEVTAEDLNTSTPLLFIIKKAGFASTNSEIRRLFEQGAVRINENKIMYMEGKFQSGDVLQVGKKNFIKLVIK